MDYLLCLTAALIAVLYVLRDLYHAVKRGIAWMFTTWPKRAGREQAIREDAYERGMIDLARIVRNSEHCDSALKDLIYVTIEQRQPC